MNKKRIAKRSIWILIIIFLCMNVVAAFHAYKFTHFNPTAQSKTKGAKQLTLASKLKVLFTGIDNPRPKNKILPTVPFKTIQLKSNKQIECWHIEIPNNKGTVILFHGYSGNKSGMHDKATEFLNMGYSVLLPDFMGAGGSQGNQCTIGFYEAEQVKTAFDYIKSKGEKNVILFGTSMGAAAVMRAISEYQLQANALILECPFGSMLQTVKARFHTMHVPPFPMAHLLVFWGGMENDFNAYSHNPLEYAKNIKVKTLLMYGLKDEEVSAEETNGIFNNLNGEKKLKTFATAAHENYLKNYSAEWKAALQDFLN